MKKGFTLIELLSVIVILAVIAAIAYPKVLDVIGASRVSAYNSAKGNIIESAKLKYLADVNASKVTEYSVSDLISDGYLKKGIKNPLTNKEYENTKVVIINDNGKISYEYVEGNTLYDSINNLDDKEGLYKENDYYIYKGINANNYISFNEEVYRILKMDSYRNMYIVKNTDDNVINFDSIGDTMDTYYNDNYPQEKKDKILGISILNYQDYQNSYLDGETFIQNNNDIWVKNGSEYRVLSYIDNDLNTSKEAHTRYVLKIKNIATIKSGNGTQINPYILD